MRNLAFDPDRCFNCDSYECLIKCKYLNYDFERAKQERIKLAKGEYTKLLEECVTCYACEEYCPYGNHPFYRIVELQEEFEVNVAPIPITKQLVRMYAPKEKDLSRITQVGGRALSLCLFPDLKSNLKSKLFEGLPVILGRQVFCNLVYLHFAKPSTIHERAQQTIENISKYGVKELVCFHDECYGFFNSYAKAYGLEVPFKTIHLFEYLYETLKEKEDELRKLNLKVAYQRPCSNRLSPGTDEILDKIFELIGVERVEREHDRENALCCGAVFRMQGRDELADDVQKRNIQDMVNSKANFAVFNCPMCYVTLGEYVAKKGLMPLLISDLCRLALGETPKIPGRG
jgi:Fe-S oxidoreductase